MLLWTILAVGLWANMHARGPGAVPAGKARLLVGEIRGEMEPLRRVATTADATFRGLRGIKPPVIFLQFEDFDPDSARHCEYAGLYYNKAVYWLTDTRVYVGEPRVINSGEDVLRAQAAFTLTPGYIAANGIEVLVTVSVRDGQLHVQSRYLGGGL